MKSMIALSVCLLLFTTIHARLVDLLDEPEVPNKPEEQETPDKPEQPQETSSKPEQPAVSSSYKLSPCYTCYQDCKRKAAETCYHICPRKFRLARLLSMCYEMCLLGNIDRCMLLGMCFQRKEIESLTGVRGGVVADANDYIRDSRSLLKRFGIPN